MTLRLTESGLDKRMREEDFHRWLDAYGKAWETGDPVAVIELFTPDARYHWTPFEEPKRGREEIAVAWRNATSRQEDIHFSHEIVTVAGRDGIARWWCELVRTPTGRRVKLDGIFLLTFRVGQAGGILCERLREWWHSEERKA